MKESHKSKQIIKIYSTHKVKKNSAAGGGNQFLNNLFSSLKDSVVIVDDIKIADIVLCNNYQILNGNNLLNWLKTLKAIASKPVVHRVAGPIHKMRGRHLSVDRFIYYFNRFFSDVTIFQSNYSKYANIDSGMTPSKSFLIQNATSREIFFPLSSHHKKNEKIKLISTSWSKNKHKGLDYFKYLDENLDFQKYEYNFIGNIEYKFKNINVLKPVAHSELSKLLRCSDIFIFPSLNDPCPNSLIEAIASGLPSIAHQSGGSKEIINEAGELFKSKEDLLSKIDMVSKDLTTYREKIVVNDLNLVSHEYLEVFKEAKNSKKTSIVNYFVCIYLWGKYKVIEKYFTP